MRIELRIDNVSKQISSTNPELLGAWLVEMFSSVNWNPATYCQVFVWPDVDYRGGAAPVQADWATNSMLYRPYEVRSPRELVDQLSAALDEWEGR